MTRDALPVSTMFDRCVLFQQVYLDIGRRYIQAFGLAQGVNAIMEDMSEGRLSREKAQQVLNYMHYLFIEYLVRRVGFTRFGAVLEDPEYQALQAESVVQEQRRQGPNFQEQHARAIEAFAWNSLRHWHLAAHDQGGRNVYEVHPELAPLLRGNQPRGVPRLPVPALLLIVPPEAGLRVTLKGFASRDVTEIYVVESPPPRHQWSVWLHAPIDEYLNESVYLELSFTPEGLFEDSIGSAHDMFQGESPQIEGWRECVRWLGAAMRYLAEGGARQEVQPEEVEPEEVEPVRRVLIGVSEPLQ